eukprot:194255_1
MAIHWTHVMNGIATIFFFIVSAILVGYCIILFKATSIESRQNSETTNERSLSTHNKTTYNASKCAIISFAFSCVSYSLMYIAWLIHFFLSENPDLVIWLLLWDAFNFLVYAFGIWLMLFAFLLRIHSAFKHSFLAYPKSLIICLYAFIFVIGITILLCVVAYAMTHDMLIWLGPLCVIEEVIFDVVLLYVLFRKLFGIFLMRGARSMNTDVATNNNADGPPVIELKTLETTTMYATLILLGIISTEIVATIIALRISDGLEMAFGALIALDIYVNGTCLFLMFSVNKQRYHKYCSKYHTCLQICCINCTYKGAVTSSTTKQQYTGLVLADGYGFVTSQTT